MHGYHGQRTSRRRRAGRRHLRLAWLARLLLPAVAAAVAVLAARRLRTGG
jgi:hypothetical protein